MGAKNITKIPPAETIHPDSQKNVFTVRMNLDDNLLICKMFKTNPNFNFMAVIQIFFGGQ